LDEILRLFYLDSKNLTVTKHVSKINHTVELLDLDKTMLCGTVSVHEIDIFADRMRPQVKLKTQ
jgi:hypothetical protein